MKVDKENLAKELAGARMLHHKGNPLRETPVWHIFPLNFSALPAGYNKNMQLSAKPLMVIFNLRHKVGQEETGSRKTKRVHLKGF